MLITKFRINNTKIYSARIYSKFDVVIKRYKRTLSIERAKKMCIKGKTRDLELVTKILTSIKKCKYKYRPADSVKCWTMHLSI